MDVHVKQEDYDCWEVPGDVDTGAASSGRVRSRGKFKNVKLENKTLASGHVAGPSSHEEIGAAADVQTLKNQLEATRRERDALLQVSTTMKTERDAYLAECNEMKAVMAKYNPEVINRQEELLLLNEPPTGTALKNPPITLDPSPDPMMRMRQGLCYLGVRRGPRSHQLEGKTRFNEFRTWLRHRVHVNTAQTIPRGSTNVFAGVEMPVLSRTASRLCKAPPLFVEDFVTWCTKPLFHGIYVCPDYVYGSTATYTQPIWSRGDQWHACGEQDREVFYVKGGQIFYAGTYVCHTGPGQLRIHHLGRIGSEALVDQLVRITHKGGNIPAERDAVRDLYIEGTLTVHVLGLERVGFNVALHQDLTSSLRMQNANASSSKTANAPLSKKQRKRARAAAAAAAAAAGQQHPLPPQPPPATNVQVPGPSRGPLVHPSRMAVAPVFHNEYVPLNLPTPQFAQYPPPSYMHVGALPRPHPLPPRPFPYQAPRAPSELEYADEEIYGDEEQYDGYDEYSGRIKREREEDDELHNEGGSGRAHKVPKLEDELEEERWVEEQVRAPSQVSQLPHPGVYLEDEVYYEPYMGWKDEY